MDSSPSKESSVIPMSPLLLSPSPPPSPFPTVLQETHSRGPCVRQEIQELKIEEVEFTKCREEKLQLEGALQEKTKLEARLKKAETTPSASSSTQLTRPKAGAVEAILAQKFKMVDIGSSLFIYMDQYAKVMAKAKDGKSMIRELMNIFFSREQLCSGSIDTLDSVIFKAIIGFIMSNQKVTFPGSQLRQCILRKMSGYKHKEKTRKLTTV